MPVSYTHLDVYKRQANPFALEWQMYFEERETDKLRDTLNGRVKLLNIFQRQKGLCAVCRCV